MVKEIKAAPKSAPTPGDKVRNAAIAPFVCFLVGAVALLSLGQTDAPAALLYFIGGGVFLCFLMCCGIFALAHHTDAVVWASQSHSTAQPDEEQV